MTVEGTTWAEVLSACSRHLGSEHEARRILEHIGRSRNVFQLHRDQAVPTDLVERIDELIRRRMTGEPLQYVLGTWAFRELELLVDARVLIPRPETEQVVQAVLNALAKVDAPTVVDLGTGSGAIALSLATELQCREVWATDTSADALDVARGNWHRLCPSRTSLVQFAQGYWFDALPERLRNSVDALVANPPYVATSQDSGLERQVRDWEPHSALFAGPDGTDDLCSIIDGACEWLVPGGMLVLEMAPEQIEPMCDRALRSGFVTADAGKDLAGRYRWLKARTLSREVER